VAGKVCELNGHENINMEWTVIEFETADVDGKVCEVVVIAWNIFGSVMGVPCVLCSNM
jgi:hypothetical protein